MTEHTTPAQEPLPERPRPANYNPEAGPMGGDGSSDGSGRGGAGWPGNSNAGGSDGAGGQAAPRSNAPIVWAIIIGVLVIAGAIVAATLFLLRDSDPVATPVPVETEPEVAAAEVTASPAPTPAEAPILIGDCAALNPPAQAANDAFVMNNDVSEHGEIGRAEFDRYFGPAAQSTIALASQSQGCLYIYDFHAGLVQFVSQVDVADQSPLHDALAADSDFIASEIAGFSVHTWAADIDSGPIAGTEYTVHAFLGEVWVATQGYEDPAAMLPPLLDSILAANPSLAP